MSTFREYLTETLEAPGKLLHIKHVEDRAFDGEDGFNNARDTLKEVHKRINGLPTTIHVATKYDGSPSTVFGHCPHTGKFFVGTKAALSKTPKLMYSHEDIDEHYGDKPELASKLHVALKHLPSVTPHTGIYQGDFMYDENTRHEDNHAYHFTPNTLMYSVDKSDPDAKKIGNSHMGMVVHTKYYGNDMTKMVAGFKPDLHNFRNHKDVYIINPELQVQGAMAGHDLTDEFVKHMWAADKTRRHSHPGTFKDTSIHREHLNRYINHTVRTGDKPTAVGFKQHLTDLAKEKINQLKTPRGREDQKTRLMQHLIHIDNHHDRYQSILDMHHHLRQAKKVLLNSLDSHQRFKTSLDGNDVPGEGYVVSLEGQPPVKLVNRDQFSKANFAKHDTSK